MLQQQQMLMDHQDVHLDELSRSITRQRDLSLQINDELDVHTGLLEGLDHDMDRTDSRLTGARRRLDRVAKGAKENGTRFVVAARREAADAFSARVHGHDWAAHPRATRTYHRVQNMMVLLRSAA